MPSILTPKAISRPVTGKKPLTFWKQIVPTFPVHYTDPKTGARHRLNFDDPQYHRDLLSAFRQRLGPDSVAFQLADSKNNHGRDLSPEQQRGVVQEMVTFEELPPKVQAKIQAQVQTGRVKDPHGTYAKIRMFDEQAAKAVHDNADLAVSARIREGFVRADGTPVPRAVVHVCGTYDSQVVGMSPWTEADLTVYPDGDGVILDLSNATYDQEAEAVAKSKGKGKGGGTATVDDRFSPEALAQLSDEDLRELADELDLDVEAILQGLEPGDDDDDSDEDDSDEDDADSDSDAASDRVLAGAGAGAADLSVTHRIALAAGQRADEALRQLALNNWNTERERLLGAGVPPAAIDLAEPYLSAPGGFIVDLSNSDGEPDEHDVAGDIRKMLAMLGGYVDLANEAGHGGEFQATADADPDAPMLEQWNKQFPG